MTALAAPVVVTFAVGACSSSPNEPEPTISRNPPCFPYRTCEEAQEAGNANDTGIADAEPTDASDDAVVDAADDAVVDAADDADLVDGSS